LDQLKKGLSLSKQAKVIAKVFMFFGLTMGTHVFVYTKSACIIIHGTWAKDCAWYLPEGNFYEPVKSTIQELRLVDEMVSFRWSGLLGDLAHQEAAENLAKTILNYESVILIAHSHGATVGIIASMMLGSKNSERKFSGKIKKFYALGVPVDSTRIVYPDMSVIDKFYNFFSFGDLVQRVHGLYDRCFATHARITNIAVLLHGLHPSHSDLHDREVGQHLLKIPDYFQQRVVGNFAKYCDGQPAEISFCAGKLPVYGLQSNQEKLLELDQLSFELAQKAFFRGQK